MLANEDYQTRVAAGKKVEADIIKFLRSRGFNVEVPSPDEDMKEKIDCIIVEGDQRHTVQIKFRESGDDIPFEIVKDLEKNLIGRDMICKAGFYLVVDRNNRGQIFKIGAIKALAQKVLDEVKKDLGAEPDKVDWVSGDGNWEAKIRQDKFHGQKKLMGFFRAAQFKSINLGVMPL